MPGKCQWLVAIAGGVKLNFHIKIAYVVDLYLLPSLLARKLPIVKKHIFGILPRVTQVTFR